MRRSRVKKISTVHELTMIVQLAITKVMRQMIMITT